MPYLEKSLRRQLASTIDKARLVAEEGAADAIRRLGVAEDAAPTWLSESDRLLRRILRAHARSLGDVQVGSTLQGTTHLMETAAFEHWHRMLFGRFLVERGLLVHPTMGVVLERGELAELAAEEGLPDEWALVERIAAPALPAVFKPDDPALKLPLAPEYAKRLRDLVAGLPEAVFAADDSLGWTYQFWRAAEKERVNQADGKIGAAELPVVTQLFTEPYMVRFLLHNTLGAWHAGRVLSANPALVRDAVDEPALRAACALPGYEWEFLRFVREGDAWRPAAGTFPGWPDTAAAVTVLDPCCGSGHFLTEALAALAALRGAEESLPPADAVAAVLSDNLHGLEIDGRCVQIAAFALALAAWRIGGAILPLPVPHVAWVGAPPPLAKAEFCALANGDVELRQGLGALYDLFVQAPLLGSLIEVTGGDLIDPARMARLDGSMDALVERLRGTEPERVEGVLAARGMADAAAILAQRFVLQATNVPYLGRADHSQELRVFLHRSFRNSQNDLATAMLSRMLQLLRRGGTVAHVTIQNWLFLGNFRKFRQEILSEATLNLITTLGEEAWEAFGQRGPLATLLIVTHEAPKYDSNHVTLDVTKTPELNRKIELCSAGSMHLLSQREQVGNPDQRLTTIALSRVPLLSQIAIAGKGSTTGDTDNYHRYFWEQDWAGVVRWLDSPTGHKFWSGRSLVLRVSIDDPRLVAELGCRIHGQQAWGKTGVAVRKLRELTAFAYDGELFDDNISAIVPINQESLPAVWAFVSSKTYSTEIRKIDSKRNVTSSTLVKVPFDLLRWQASARQTPICGFTEPYSDDPTQWLFHGHPAHADSGTELHVALARLAGYRWPAETDAGMRLAPLARERITLARALPGTDATGLLSLHAHSNQRPLADRLRALLAAAYSAPVDPEQEAALVRTADTKCDGKGARDVSLEAWLANRAFRQHCSLFHNRPFLWQVWDGLPGGFSAFLHYHRLDAAALQSLTYTLLGDWITRQTAAGDTAREEAARRLQQNLIAIAQGEAPLDIFVRWKSLAQQPVGWNPDLDDGVRLNIRPFIITGVLREQPRGIAWGKDRGTDVASAPWYELGPQYGEKPGSRINNHHLTLAQKQAARTQAAAE